MKLTDKNKSIIYVNFAPYENAGNILDFLRNNYSHVFLFCFNFHALTHRKEPSQLTIFIGNKIIHTYPLYYLPTPQRVALILLPIRSIIIFIQLLFHGIRLRYLYGQIDDYITVNAFTAWCGNVLKRANIVRRTIFWIWDYYPPQHPSLITKIMRWLYWQFDIPASIESTKTVYLNSQLFSLRQNLGITLDTPPIVVEIGTNPIKHISKKGIKSVHLVFLGVLKQNQGLDLLLEAQTELTRTFPALELHIIGGGPEEDHYRRAFEASCLKTHFYGYVASEEKVDQIIGKSHIGVCLYEADKKNIATYTDSSKIKRYLSQGLPVVSTNTLKFAQRLTRGKAGISISYNAHEFTSACQKIVRQYNLYAQNALNLAGEYKYKKTYKRIFESNEKV